MRKRKTHDKFVDIAKANEFLFVTRIKEPFICTKLNSK